MNEQLGAIQPSDVDAAIAQIKANNPQYTDTQILEAMNQATQYGSYNQLNDLQQQLNDGGYQVLDTIDGKPMEGTTGSTLNYLKEKQQPGDATMPSSGVTPEGAPNPFLAANGTKPAYVVDEPTLAAIQNSPETMAKIRSGEIKLIYPAGWEEGLTPFNANNAEDLVSKTEAILKNGGNPSYEMEARVKALGLPMETITNPSMSSTPTSQVIADNLKPNAMSPEAMADLINKFPTPESQQAAMDILSQDARVFSPQSISRTVAKQHQQILDYAASKGIKPEDIYYGIPDPGKSYGLVTQQYAAVNNIPPGQILQPGQLPPEGNTMLVVLDDATFSGNTIGLDVRSEYSRFSGVKVVSPILSTQERDKLWGFKFLPQEVKPSFLDSPEFESMSPEKQDLYKSVMGDLGYGFKAHSVAFPYMSPDNNNEFFGSQIAKHYTLNAGGIKLPNNTFSQLQYAFLKATQNPSSSGTKPAQSSQPVVEPAAPAAQPVAEATDPAADGSSHSSLPAVVTAAGATAVAAGLALQNAVAAGASEEVIGALGSDLAESLLGEVSEEELTETLEGIVGKDKVAEMVAKAKAQAAADAAAKAAADAAAKAAAEAAAKAAAEAAAKAAAEAAAAEAAPSGAAAVDAAVAAAVAAPSPSELALAAAHFVRI